jgi:hypothetical protein
MLALSGQVDLYTIQKLLTHKDPNLTKLIYLTNKSNDIVKSNYLQIYLDSSFYLDLTVLFDKRIKLCNLVKYEIN